MTEFSVDKYKYFSFEIKDRNFDLMMLQGGIQNFGEKYGLSHNQVYRLQICTEELVYEMLSGCYKKPDKVEIKVGISYSELKGTAELSITSGGKEFNPFEQDEDGLGVTILKTMAQSISYLRDGDKNRIRIEL